MENFVRSPEGLELAALCIDYKYKFTGRIQDLTRDQINFLMAALSYRIEQTKPSEAGMRKIIITED
ncbi:MAG: hypothetical protein A7316_10865 [Candidatus Altiarchaeales archaeon WOR_SM1_86-2]|nr:MAG: hypothetical protein A7316_10865 [Candidatus Altiarchaeales archaeon WOR_SM1_86-2]